MEIREYKHEDLAEMAAIWNEVVDDGIAFPQEERLTIKSAEEFFRAQSFTGVAVENGRVYGLYILHPNNIGRCGHICNASYAVASEARGKHTGALLVTHCLNMAKELGFKVMQFNAVVESNVHARRLYERMGFVQLGTIPGGFRMKDGSYENICPYYRVL